MPYLHYSLETGARVASTQWPVESLPEGIGQKEIAEGLDVGKYMVDITTGELMLVPEEE